MEQTRFTKTQNGYRWVLARRELTFVAYPQMRCTTDTGKVYFKHLHVPVASFATQKELEDFIASGASAELWAKGEPL